MSGWGRAGPFLHGTAAQRATIVAADVALGDAFYETDTGDRYRVADASPLVWVALADPLSDTLANLQGLGTDDGIAVGQPAWDTTNIRTVYCLSVAASSSVWVVRWEHRFQSNAPSAALRYFEWGGPTARGTITGGTQRPTSGAGAVTNVRLYMTTDPGSTVIGLHLDANTTAAETETVDPGAAAVYTDFPFDTTNTYTAGQRLTISINATDVPGITLGIVKGYEVAA